MIDRIVDLEGIPEGLIKAKGYQYLLEDDYLVPEAILLAEQEVEAYGRATEKLYKTFQSTLDEIAKEDDWSWIDLPAPMINIIKYSWEHRHIHILGRFDLAGGIERQEINLIEYNADTPTMIPESSDIQKAFLNYYPEKKTQFNHLFEDLVRAFNKLADDNSNAHHSMLFTSLGYEEDRNNLTLLMEAAEEAGFLVEYADLENIIFDEDQGVFLENKHGEFTQFDFLYKLVPWEFTCFEELELLRILEKLVLSDLVYVINPGYSLVFQSKYFLEQLYLRNSDNEHLLKTSRSKSTMKGKYVEKVVFGRLGENVKIYNEDGEIMEENDGDFGNFPSIYQEYTPLYQDEDGDIYQLGMFTVMGKPSCISFRRVDGLIITDDAEFIPHIIM